MREQMGWRMWGIAQSGTIWTHVTRNSTHEWEALSHVRRRLYEVTRKGMKIGSHYDKRSRIGQMNLGLTEWTEHIRIKSVVIRNQRRIAARSNHTLLKNSKCYGIQAFSFLLPSGQSLKNERTKSTKGMSVEVLWWAWESTFSRRWRLPKDWISSNILRLSLGCIWSN